MDESLHINGRCRASGRDQENWLVAKYVVSRGYAIPFIGRVEELWY